MTAKIQVACRTCGKTHQMTVPADGYLKWKDGMLIQKAMPQLSPDERELLISNTCLACFDRMFKDE